MSYSEPITAPFGYGVITPEEATKILKQHGFPMEAAEISTDPVMPQSRRNNRVMNRLFATIMNVQT